MKWSLFLLLSTCCLSFQSQSQRWKKWHDQAIVIDAHNDFPTAAVDKGYSLEQDLRGKTYSDLNRFRQGGVDIQIFAIWCDGSYGPGKAFARAMQEIDTVYKWIERNPSRMMLVKNSKDLYQAVKEKKLGTMLGVEGGHMIEDDLDKLQALYNRGVRYMTMTWNNSTSWASSAMDESMSPLQRKIASTRRIGLNDMGRQVVRRMNEIGMLVDLSHVGEQTFWDVLETTTKPVLVSHSCAYALCPVPRNLKDDQIRAVAKNGGVIHLNFFSGFVDSSFIRNTIAFFERHRAERDSMLKTVSDPYFADAHLFEKYAAEASSLRPPLSLLLDHLDYIVKLAGVDHVGLGSDFDGITSSPQQLDDVRHFPLITRELIKRGYRKNEIKKILGGNFIRLLKAVEVN